MKLYNRNFLKVATICIVLMVACTEEERIPEFQKAANVRIQFANPADQLVNYSDISNAKIKYSIFSTNQDLEKVELTFIYNNALTGLPEGPFNLKTYSQNDFDANDGAIRDEVFTAAQLATIVGKTAAQLSGGDNFVFSNTTKLMDGRIYPSTTVNGNSNITTAIQGNAATETFSVGWTSYVACPVANGYATGKYKIEQVSGPDDPFFGNPTRFINEEVTLVASSPIQRDINLTYLTFPGLTFTTLLVCNQFLVNDDAGIGCGAGLRWGTPATPGTYADADDSVLIIKVLENINGDCGVPADEPLTLKLTKVN